MVIQYTHRSRFLRALLYIAVPKYLAELVFAEVTSSLKYSQLQLSRNPGAAQKSPKLPCNSKGTITLWGNQQNLHKTSSVKFKVVYNSNAL